MGQCCLQTGKRLGQRKWRALHQMAWSWRSGSIDHLFKSSVLFLCQKLWQIFKHKCLLVFAWICVVLWVNVNSFLFCSFPETLLHDSIVILTERYKPNFLRVEKCCDHYKTIKHNKILLQSNRTKKNNLAKPNCSLNSLQLKKSNTSASFSSWFPHWYKGLNHLFLPAKEVNISTWYLSILRKPTNHMGKVFHLMWWGSWSRNVVESKSYLLLSWLDDLKRTRQAIINTHHCTSIIKLATVIGCREYRHKLSICKELISIFHNLQYQ